MDKIITYKGYLNRSMNEEEMSEFYSNKNKNVFNLCINEFLNIWDENKNLVDILKWNGNGYSNIKYKKIKNDFIGETISPLNIEQKLAFDILQDKEIKIKILSGKQGTGKDFLMVIHALNLIENKKFKKIIFLRNNIELKNTKPIGFLPDGITEKLLPFAMVVADQVGGKNNLNQMISKDILEVEHFGFVRGRSFKNSIVICSEAENLTKEQMQVLIGRIGHNSELWINGDLRQVDAKDFELNNGLYIAIERLKGHPKFAHVELSETVRSDVSEMADLLD